MGLSGEKEQKPIKGRNTPYPEDARPNPFLAHSYEPINGRLTNLKKIDAH